MPNGSISREHQHYVTPGRAPKELPRRWLGGFRLLRVLGSGGMATVYLGHRVGPTGASQFSALKVMLPHLLDDESSVQMFLDEARITSSIQHPYVCRVLDFGVDDGLPYLATEYVMGEVLSELVDALHSSEEGRVAARSVIAQVIAQACEGLHAAHEACDDEGKSLDIVHRDTAPQNIIVGYDGCVRVLDFGIARAATQLHETQSGVFRGRFAYMAPEQMEAARIDRRADVWSLGVLLWEGVAGRRLFKRSNINRTMRAVIADPIAPLLRSVADFPPDLLSVCERAIVRDVRGRFPTARSMSLELGRVLPNGASSISAWMSKLFAARLEEKRRELQSAINSESSLFPSGGAQTVSILPVVTKSGIRLSAQRPALPLQTSLPPSSVEAARPRSQPGPWSRALVICGLALSVAVGLLYAERLWAHHPMRSVNAATPSHIERLGIVRVTTVGGSASIHVDGRPVGRSPLQVALQAGRHELRISRDGRDTHVWAPIDVRAGVVHTLDIPVE